MGSLQPSEQLGVCVVGGRRRAGWPRLGEGGRVEQVFVVWRWDAVGPGWVGHLLALQVAK